MRNYLGSCVLYIRYRRSVEVIISVHLVKKISLIAWECGRCELSYYDLVTTHFS